MSDSITKLGSPIKRARRILVTEPRAIAAESVAKRVQSEMSKSGIPDKTVGWVVGPNLNLGADTQIVYMTEHEFLS